MASQRIVDAANQAVKSEIDSLRSEVTRLTDLVADMAKSGSDFATRNVRDVVDRARGTASDVTDKARGKASDAADAFMATGRQAVERVSRRVEPLTHELAASVERNPLSALVVAAGLGLLVGLFVRSGK